MDGAACIWRSLTPMICKISIWLAMQYRLWTADQHTRHGLQDETSTFYTCLQEEDTVDCIFMVCVYSHQVWLGCYQRLGIHLSIPLHSDSLQSWWPSTRSNFGRIQKLRFDTLIIRTSAGIYGNNKMLVFQNINKQLPVPLLINHVVA
jgi:hypothetical protein